MGFASTESLLYEAATLVELGALVFCSSACGVRASVWRQVDHLALSGRGLFHLDWGRSTLFLVAVSDLGKRRKPHPAGCMSSVALILGEDSWIHA